MVKSSKSRGGRAEREESGGEPDPGASVAAPEQLDPAVLAQIAELRSQVRESFGKAVMAMMMLPRYRGQTLGDLQHLVLDPLIRDRIAIARPADPSSTPGSDIAGLAIWASVSEEADARIREQIKTGTFPVRLKPEDWNSGENNWLLDVIAPNQRATATVIANFRQVVKQGSLRLHPLITRLVDEETLTRMGAEKMPTPAGERAETTAESEAIN